MNKRYVYWVVVIIVAMVLWFLVDYPFVGQMLIVLYAIYALWRSVAAQSVIRLALGVLAVVFVAIIALNGQAASAFAGYGFSLFIVAAVVLSRELRQHSVALRKQREEEKA